MTKRFGRVVLLSIAILGIAGVAHATGSSGSSGSGGPQFTAKLSGAQEVPEVTTTTAGSLELKFDAAFTQARFILKVSDGLDVTAAHLHCHRAGENGPPVAFLYGEGPTIDVDGRLASGTLTNEDLEDADCLSSVDRSITNLAALAFAAKEGLIYVNVHTEANPSGESRGQLVAADGDDGHCDDDDDDDDDDGGRGRRR